MGDSKLSNWQFKLKAIIKLNAVATAAAVKCFINKVIELSQTAIFLSPHISNHYKSIDCAQKKNKSNILYIEYWDWLSPKKVNYV